MSDTGTRGERHRRAHPIRIALLSGVGVCSSLFGIAAHGHGYMTYPVSRAAEHLPGDLKGWPIAGIKATLRREPCSGLAQNTSFTPLRPGPSQLEFLFPDGANHVGSCSAFLFDPLRPDDKVRIGNAPDCARSAHAGPGEKGQDISGHMSVLIPRELPCDPSHCVLQWVWTATHRSATDSERFEHYDNCADIEVIGGRRAAEGRTSPPLVAAAIDRSPSVAIGQGHLQHLLAVAAVDGGAGREEAIEMWQRRLDELVLERRIDPVAETRAKAENRKGKRQLRDGDVRAALRAFHVAYRLAPTDAEVINNLGYAYLLGDDPEAAEPFLLLALIYEPRRTNAWANLGQSYARRGKLDEAVASFALAYRHSGDRGVTYRFLQRLAKSADADLAHAASRTLQSALVRDDRR